jgi:hypothetical protein
VYLSDENRRKLAAIRATRDPDGLFNAWHHA